MTSEEKRKLVDAWTNDDYETAAQILTPNFSPDWSTAQLMEQIREYVALSVLDPASVEESNLSGDALSQRIAELIYVARMAETNIQSDVHKNNFRPIIVLQILNAANGELFVATDWVSQAAGASELNLPDWTASLTWLRDKWLQPLLSHFRTQNEIRETREFGFFAARDEGHRPLVLHPLTLSQMGPILKKPEFEIFAHRLSNWLSTRVLVANPSEHVSIESAFSVGATVLKLAQDFGITYTDTDGEFDAEALQVTDFDFASKPEEIDDEEWKKTYAEKVRTEWEETVSRIVDAFVVYGTGGNDAPKIWQDRKRVQDLINACPFWHKPDDDTQLQAAVHIRARKKLQNSIKALDGSVAVTTLNSADTELRHKLRGFGLSGDLFAPGLNDISRIALPDRRPEYGDEEAGFTDDPSWDSGSRRWRSERDPYFKHLAAVQHRVQAVEQVGKLVSSAASSFDGKRQLIEKWVASPFAQPQLLDSLQSEQEMQISVARLLQGHLPALRPYSGAYSQIEMKDRLLSSSASWIEAINALGYLNDEKYLDLLHTWARLEPWDVLRASCRSDDNEANKLVSQLPQWIMKGENAPTNINLADLRPRLAAVVHIVVASTSGQLATGITDLLDRVGDLVAPLDRFLAATRLEMIMTQITAGVAPGDAFPKLPDDSPNLASFGHWIQLALGSDNAWETRAGLNGLILLARMGDTLDDVFIGSALQGFLSSSLIDLIHYTIGRLLTEGDGHESSLPLAYVAADLSRYERIASSGIAESGDLVYGRPAWLPVKLNGDTPDAEELIETLDRRFSAWGLKTTHPFANDGGLPLRQLCLTILRIRLDQYARTRRLSVQAPRRAQVEPLQALRRGMRVLVCRDAILSGRWSGGTNLIWWQAQFWAGELAQVEDLTDINYRVRSDKNTPALALVNWMPTARNDGTFSALQTAAALEAAVPTMPPEIQPFMHTGVETGEPAVVYDYRLLRDIDERVEGEFPKRSWKASRDALDTAVKNLKEFEGDYRDSLIANIDLQGSAEMRELLKHPLRLSTADFQEQIEVAIAEVRQAESELEAARAESIAAVMEESASGLIYEAAKLELSRQGLLVQIADLDTEISEAEQEIAFLEKEARGERVDQAEAQVRIDELNLKRHTLKVQQVVAEREQVRFEIEMMINVLGSNQEPLQTPVPLAQEGYADFKERYHPINGLVEEADGSLTANGQLAAMAVRIEVSLTRKLYEGLEEAHQELASAEREERKRKRKEKRNKLVKSVCRAVGAAVGAFFGGPSGAALGAEIGEALGEIGVGIADGKPPEDILLGLVDNAFSIAGAANYDLEGELNELGAKGLAEASALFESANSSIGLILDTLPTVFDETLLEEAFNAFGLDEVPELARVARLTFETLPAEIDSFANSVDNAGGLGSILKGASRFESAHQFKEHLDGTLLNGLFEQSRGHFQQIQKLGAELGADWRKLQTVEGRQEVAQKLLESGQSAAIKELNELGYDGLESGLEQLGMDVIELEELGSVLDVPLGDLLTESGRQTALDKMADFAEQEVVKRFQAQWSDQFQQDRLKELADQHAKLVKLAASVDKSLDDLLTPVGRKTAAELMAEVTNKEAIEAFRLERLGLELDKLEALGRAVGVQQITDLEQIGLEEAAKRTSTLVIAGIGKAASGYRSKIVAEWLTTMQGRSWNDANVQEEAQHLLDNFFPNPQARAQVEANLRWALTEPEVKTAMAGEHLQAWQAVLDTMLNEIMDTEKLLNVRGSRVDVARAQVNYLSKAMEGFNSRLLPFLKAETGHDTARNELLAKLYEKQRELEDWDRQVEIDGTFVAKAKEEIEQARSQVEEATIAVEQAGVLVRARELGVERTSLMLTVAETARLEAGTLAEAKEKSSQAAAERAKAAKARERAAESSLAARRAYETAVRHRGAEAQRIRGALSRPAVRLPDPRPDSTATKCEQHAEKLELALKAYRELLRFYNSIGAQAPKLRPISLDTAEPGTAPATWSTLLFGWLEGTNDFSRSPIFVNEVSPPLKAELTPEQIRALFSPQGLRFLGRPKGEAPEDPSQNLFSVPTILRSDVVEIDLWNLLDNDEVIGRNLPQESPWREIFRDQGIPLSENAHVSRKGTGLIITNDLAKPVEVQYAGADPWQIGCKDRYLLKRHLDRSIRVIRDIHRYELYEDRFIEGLPAAQLRSGRIRGIFLTLHDKLNNVVGASDFTIRARHLGDVRISREQLVLQRPNEMENRLYFITPDKSLGDRLEELSRLSRDEGDPDSLVVQGLPISGTIILNLLPDAADGTEIHRAELQILYKWYLPDGELG